MAQHPEEGYRWVLTSGERVHQALVRVGRDVCVGGLFWLANLRVAFSEFQPYGLRHVGIEPDALLPKPNTRRIQCDHPVFVKRRGQFPRGVRVFGLLHRFANVRSNPWSDIQIVTFVRSISSERVKAFLRSFVTCPSTSGCYRYLLITCSQRRSLSDLTKFE